MGLEQVRVGIGLTGSFCTFTCIEGALGKIAGGLVDHKRPIYTFVLSYHAQQLPNRFCTPEELEARLKKLSPHPVIKTIPDAEPLGPKNRLDVFAIAPCTGNTLAKLASGVTDTPECQKNIQGLKLPILLGFIIQHVPLECKQNFRLAVGLLPTAKDCGIKNLSLTDYSRT